MNLSYIKQSHLSQLKTNVGNNIDRYKESTPWLTEYLGNDNWYLSSNVPMDDFTLFTPEGRNNFDLENTQRLYTELKHLSITQATDERLWAYLTHITFWEYMRARWPAESYLGNPQNLNPAENIREHYCFMSNSDRALVRNGISRLWWYGYVSYDENRADPFELTKVLLRNLSVAHDLLERSFSRNQMLSRTVLAILFELEQSNRPFVDREKFRKLMKHINQLGGVIVLDALDEKDLRKLILNQIEKLT